jgi:hypothetical protein
MFRNALPGGRSKPPAQHGIAREPADRGRERCGVPGRDE